MTLAHVFHVFFMPHLELLMFRPKLVMLSLEFVTFIHEITEFGEEYFVFS